MSHKRESVLRGDVLPASRTSRDKRSESFEQNDSRRATLAGMTKSLSILTRYWYQSKYRIRLNVDILCSIFKNERTFDWVKVTFLKPRKIARLLSSCQRLKRFVSWLWFCRRACAMLRFRFRHWRGGRLSGRLD